MAQRLPPDMQAFEDSLTKLIADPASHDTTRAVAYAELSSFYGQFKPDTTMVLIEEAFKIVGKYKGKKVDKFMRYRLDLLEAHLYSNSGFYHFHFGDIKLAEENWLRAVEIAGEIGSIDILGTVYNNLASYYERKGDIGTSLDMYEKSLKYREQLGEDAAIANSLVGLGALYSNQEEYDKALEAYFRALNLLEKEQHKVGIAYTLNNIANVYDSWDSIPMAIDYYNRSLAAHEEIGNPKGMVATLLNVGAMHKAGGNLTKARASFERAIELSEQIGDQEYLALNTTALADIDFAEGQVERALERAELGLELGRRLEHLNILNKSSVTLYELHKHLGNWRRALDMYELHIQMRDSSLNEANSRKVIRSQYKYAYEKRTDSISSAQAQKDMLAAAEQKRKDEIAEKDAERKNLIIYAGAGGLGLVILFSIFIVNRLRVTRKQKGIIEEQKEVVEEQKRAVEHQKEMVEEKNQEILDSINYAKRLQEAILPPRRLVKEWLPQSFILYKPKDIVAGDFYWMESIDGWIYFAAADCTGHGVPGAMVSVVCSNGLSKALLEEGHRSPATILDRTRELVIDRFGRSEEEIKDGMDISLCALNWETGQLQWAGANNPIWIIKSGSEEVEEIKADKQPIGKYGVEKPFTNHELQLNGGDSVYIFSDGYPDQFGGDRGKKYKSGKLKKFLLSIQDEEMVVQRERLDDEFESWRGDIEQIDDVCVIGVRV